MPNAATIYGALLASLMVLIALPSAGQTPGPQGNPSREQEWRIPAVAGSPLLSTMVYRPRGDGPWPLMLANHGSPAPDAPATFRNVTDWFVERGYVVAVPWRRGYGRTDGPLADDFGTCARPNYQRAGLESASDMKAVLDYLRAQPFVLPVRAIVLGHSAGGWGTIALSASNPSGVSGMVSFAGGRGGRCDLPGGGVGVGTAETLVAAAATFGTTARVPMLWIYASNDSYFNPTIARRLADAYNGAGGRADLRQVGPVGSDGHQLVSSRPGLAVWQPLLAGFIKDM